MAQGKYSPCLVHGKEYGFNCYGQEAVTWNKYVADTGVEYDEKTMSDNYDDEGFDTYGYSCFDLEGNYVGIGQGVDRIGYTEDEYYLMSYDNWLDACSQAEEYKRNKQLKLC